MSTPNLDEAFDSSPEKVERTAIEVSELLKSKGIKHALVGGLAVGAYGYPRKTIDVDFILNSSAYTITSSGLVYMNDKLPYEGEGGVRIDYVTVKNSDKDLDDAIADAEESNGIPVVPIETLVLMKLVANRARDRADVVGLIKAGMSISVVRLYIGSHAHKMLPLFDRMVEDSKNE